MASWIWVNINPGNRLMPDLILIFSSTGFCAIPLRTNSPAVPMNLFRNMCSDIALFKLLPHLQGASALPINIREYTPLNNRIPGPRSLGQGHNYSFLSTNCITKSIGTFRPHPWCKRQFKMEINAQCRMAQEYMCMDIHYFLLGRLLRNVTYWTAHIYAISVNAYATI